jgi:hypothetical protein
LPFIEYTADEVTAWGAVYSKLKDFSCTGLSPRGSVS